jgi:hypothetical protein
MMQSVNNRRPLTNHRSTQPTNHRAPHCSRSCELKLARKCISFASSRVILRHQFYALYGLNVEPAIRLVLRACFPFLRQCGENNFLNISYYQCSPSGVQLPTNAYIVAIVISRVIQSSSCINHVLMLIHRNSSAAQRP